MKLSITTDIDLESRGPSAYFTWLDVRVGDRARASGEARVALVHVGEIADAAGDVLPALHGTPLERLYDVYFSQGWYKDEFADGAGIDLLFVDRVDVAPAHRAKKLDLAIVRRLCDTIGSGCQLAVMAYADAETAARWTQLGFEISTPGRTTGFLHLKLGQRHARVVDATGSGDFELVGSPAAFVPTRGTAN